MLGNSDNHAADTIDKQDQDTGNGIPLHKFAGTVHGSVEVGLLGYFGTPDLGLLLSDETGIEIGVNGHLFPGHGIQGKACRNLGNTARTLGNYHKVDNHQNGEHDKTDHKVAAHNHIAEGLDNLTGRGATPVPVNQNHPGGGHIEGKPEQRGDKQHRRKGSEFRGLFRIDGYEQDQHGNGNVEGKEHVQKKGRHGKHDHAEAHQYQHRSAD